MPKDNSVIVMLIIVTVAHNQRMRCILICLQAAGCQMKDNKGNKDLWTMSAGTVGLRDDVSAAVQLEFPMFPLCSNVVSTATKDRSLGDLFPFTLSVIASVTGTDHHIYVFGGN